VASGSIGTRRPCHVWHMGLLPGVVERRRRRRLIGVVLEPRIPLRRDHRTVGDTRINHPAAPTFPMIATNFWPTLFLVVAITRGILADGLAAPKGENPGAPRRPVPPGKDKRNQGSKAHRMPATGQRAKASVIIASEAQNRPEGHHKISSTGSPKRGHRPIPKIRSMNTRGIRKLSTEVALLPQRELQPQNMVDPPHRQQYLVPPAREDTNYGCQGSPSQKL
jgi:hypothetical protein